jgi:thiopeptide-type bacteriocin biosynthesis protein
MPADHLTTTPHQAAAGVLTVLAGTDLHIAAASIGMAPADLDDAVQTYRAAGLTALERRADQEWYQVRVQFPDWNTAESVATAELGPRLDELQASGALSGWWFVRKHPCWRLRMHHADTTAVDRRLDELTDTRTLTRWWPTIYEPETAAFGGPGGMETAHELFCADSRGVLDYLRHPTPALGRRELSVLLISALLRTAGLDWFERGDVFHRVAQLRPAPASADTGRIETLTGNVRTLLALPTEGSALFAADGPAAYAEPWLTAFETAGHQLGAAAADGQLDRGVRAVLTHLIIFHWNRLGISATAQSILARAAATATLPRS